MRELNDQLEAYLEPMEPTGFQKCKKKVDNLDFTIASITYLAATATDYMLTVSHYHITEDFNPFVLKYVSSIGLENGLLLEKGMIAACVVLGLGAVDTAYKNSKRTFWAKHVLYPGAMATSAAGCWWLFL